MGILLVVSFFVVADRARMRGRAAVIDKTERISSLPSQKIVLLGGSNVCYGINSKLLQDSMGISVVDMSINARIGMCFYLNQVKSYLNPNDIVIAIPEYAAYFSIDYHGDNSLYSLAVIDNNNMKYFTTYQWLRAPLFLGDLLKDNYNLMITTPTAQNSSVTKGRYLYDAFGDYHGHKGKPSQLLNKEMGKEEIEFDGDVYEINKDLVNGLKSFSSYCSSKKIIFYMSYPVFARPLFNKSYADAIHLKLNSLKWLNAPEEYLYEYDELFDSPNHLLYKNRDERTYKLLNNLRRLGVYKQLQ